MLVSQLGFLAYLGLAIVIGKNSGEVEHKAYVRLPHAFHPKVTPARRLIDGNVSSPWSRL